MRDDERVIDDSDTPDSMPGDETADGDLVEAYDEHDEDVDFEDDAEDELVAEGDLEADARAEAAADDCLNQPTFVAPAFNNFMDVLYPATPPAPKNARIVRRFDLEAAKYDPRPATPAPAPTPVVTPAPAPAPEKKEPALTREELRALRNRSLRAAAGLG